MTKETTILIFSRNSVGKEHMRSLINKLFKFYEVDICPGLGTTRVLSNPDSMSPIISVTSPDFERMVIALFSRNPATLLLANNSHDQLDN